MQDERHTEIARAGLATAGLAVPLVLSFVARRILWAGAWNDFAWVGIFGVAVLAGCAIGFYASGSERQGYRATIAALFTGLAAALYATEPSWTVQNVLMGLAALISIAAIILPPLRRRHSLNEPQITATHHSA